MVDPVTHQHSPTRLRIQTQAPPDDPPALAKAAAAIMWLSVLIAALGAAYIFTRPMIWLLGYIADDSFYYLQTARHIAATGRSTFDGINPTNGYHPGWMLLMVICAKLVPGKYALVRLCLLVGFALHAASAWLMGRVLRPHIGHPQSRIAAAAWLLNPCPINLALTGVESPLLICALLTLVHAYQLLIAPYLTLGARSAPTNRGLLLFGASLAFAVCARTDMAILAAAIVLYIALSARRIRRSLTGSTPSTNMSIRIVAIPVAVAALLMLPWLAYSVATVGTVAQDSGTMKHIWYLYLIRNHGIGNTVSQGLRDYLSCYILTPATMLAGGPPVPRLPFVIAFGVLIGAALACIPAVRGHFETAGIFRLLATYAFLIGAVYVFTISDFQFWHTAATATILFLTLMAVLGCCANGAGRMRYPALLALLGFAILPAFVGLPRMTAHYPWQRRAYTSERQFDRDIPRGATIGCFNAGIPAYFGSHRVVNLDGLVNHSAVRYWRNGCFNKYLADANIVYIADTPDSIARAEQFSTRPLNLTLIDRVPLPNYPIPFRDLLRVSATP